jgi:hypothetical protein
MRSASDRWAVPLMSFMSDEGALTAGGGIVDSGCGVGNTLLGKTEAP